MQLRVRPPVGGLALVEPVHQATVPRGQRALVAVRDVVVRAPVRALDERALHAVVHARADAVRAGERPEEVVERSVLLDQEDDVLDRPSGREGGGVDGLRPGTAAGAGAVATPTGSPTGPTPRGPVRARGRAGGRDEGGDRRRRARRRIAGSSPRDRTAAAHAGTARRSARKARRADSSGGIGARPRCRRYTLVSEESTGRGAGRSSSAAVCARTSPGSEPIALTVVRTSNQHAGSRAGDVVGPPPAGEQHRQQPGGEVAHPGRAADAVAQPTGLLAARQPVDGAAEVVGAAPEHEAGADDHVLVDERANVVLAGELRAPVHRQRRRSVGLVVRRALRAVEHVVGGDMQQGGAAGACGECQVLCAHRVVAHRARRIGLARVDLREGGEVHDRVGRQQRDRHHDGRVIADVELRPSEGVHAVVRRQLREERPGQTAPGAGDEQLHAPASEDSRGAVTTSTSCAARIHSR